MKGKGMIFPAPGSLPAGDTGAVSDRATAPPTSPGPQQPSPLLTPVTLKPEQVRHQQPEPAVPLRVFPSATPPPSPPLPLPLPT
uniref:Uncharacterized protein n=1 Tax=Callorhinchus milii TaxID=7868 RepID=A0A4W3GNP6_CALMI